MELVCGLVLLIVGLTTASPYGYGTKGGAGAKADASAVAGAYAGAGEIPLSIPNGSGFSGSFSKSYSSSSASSSASSSSSSFSYSGTGVVGGVNGCGSGNCNRGTVGSQGSAAAGSQVHSGSNAGSLSGGYGGKTQPGSYGHKYNKAQDCESEGCQGNEDSTSNANSAETGSKLNNDAKASAESGHFDGPECAGPECNNLSNTDIKCSTGECAPNKKCSAGECGVASDVEGPPSQYESTTKCKSGQCGSYQDTYGTTNDIHVKTTSNPKSSYGVSGYDCSNGNCGSPEGTTLPNKPVTHLTAPKLDTLCSGTNCQNGQNHSPTEEKNPLCNGGNCDYSQTKAPYTSTQSETVDKINQTPSNGYGGALNHKPGYSHGSSPSYSPTSSVCKPGTPGCGTAVSNVPADCASGNCGPHPSAPDYGGFKPSYTSPSSPSVNPSGPACAPGSLVCNTLPLTPSGCVSGNCGQHPSSSGYDSSSHGTLPSYSTEIPLDSSCVPGKPGCAIVPSLNGPAHCTSGSCGYYPSASGNGGGSSNKPTYPQGSSIPYPPEKHLGAACAPGSLGCVTASSATYPSMPNYGGTNPSYSNGGSPLYSPEKTSVPFCTPGTPGCSVTPSFTSSADCAFGNCGTHPSAPGYSTSSNNKPSYPHGSLSFHLPGKPVGLDCVPGTPGCRTVPPVISSADCTSGNCGAYPSAPGYGHSNINPINYSPSAPLKPPSPTCAPGTPGCVSSSSSGVLSGCATGNCGSYPSTSGYGASVSIKPSYSHGSLPSYSEVKPAASLPSGSDSTGCTSGNCGIYPNSQACAPGTPGCSGVPSTILQGPSNFPLSHDTGISTPSYGASGAGSPLNQASSGSHGSGSYNKPTTGFSTGSSGAYTPGFTSAPGAVPSIGSSSYTGNVGASALANSQQAAKDDLPYTGGFGGPAEILKPNEFKAPLSSYGNKPVQSSETTSIKPACDSEVCDQSSPASPPHPHSASPTGAHASAGASASANAIAYTGGFGGPPGFLKPYDNGKVNLKATNGNQFPGSSVGLQGTGESATAQANAAAVSSAGVSSGNGYNKLRGDSSGAYSHGHDGASDCGGGCDGSSSSNYGYSGSLGHSELDSSKGIATASAVAKSVASASNGARSYGGSYASSSASAHATSGASVKGGYGRR